MNRTGKILSLASGIVLACAASSAQTTTNLLSETTFDSNAPSSWSYGYYYSDSGYGTYTNDRGYYFPEDTDMTNAVFQFGFDASALVDMTGWGTGAGAPLFRADTDPTLFTSGDRGDYIFTFDAKVAGLLDGQITANAEMQVQLYMKDENGADKKFLQVNKAFGPTVNWQTFSFTLDQASLADGTMDADLVAHHAEVSDIRFNVNLHEPFNQFGYDWDNALYLDNIKLEVVSRPIVTETPTYAKAIVDWNMDDKPAWSEWHYDWSQNENKAIFTGGNATGSNTEGVGGSTAWFLAMDTSTFWENTPQWAGGGSGGNGPADYTLLDTADMAAYRVSFDARAAGLAPDVLTTQAALQVFFDVADDTLTVDDNTDPEFLGRFDFPIGRLTADWQTYSFTLSKAGADDAAKANFAQFYNKISAVRTQWQIENATSTDWGFDADNALYVDNIRIERVYQGLSPISYAQDGADMVLTWANATTGTTTLQAAPVVTGPYIDMATEGATLRVSVTEAQKFFRLVWTAPAP